MSLTNLTFLVIQCGAYNNPTTHTYFQTNNQVNAQKRVLLAQPAPQVLVLHINRTAWHASGVHKVQTHVAFPLKLDNIQEYCTAAAVAPSSSGPSQPPSLSTGPSLKAPSKRKKDEDEPRRGKDDDDDEEEEANEASSHSSSSSMEYQLVSVVCHHGHQMSGGHFTAYGRRVVVCACTLSYCTRFTCSITERKFTSILPPLLLFLFHSFYLFHSFALIFLFIVRTTGRSAVGNPDAWWHFNDARVTKASLEEVANAQAYILMYARV